MLTGLGGRTMTYDGENRPLSVTVNNKRTCYVYGVDGKHPKKVENLPANQDCAVLPANANTTVYFGPVEIRNWQVPGQEQVLTYRDPRVKLTNGIPTYLHRNHLGSIRAITDASGAKIESAVYKPFGEQTETLSPANLTPETKGWIGERYDADAGLHYLNVRYYDPVLGMFLQPDWFEVLQPGVGTNRFSYSFNDPVNMSDPSGNCVGYNCRDAFQSKSTGVYSERAHIGNATHTSSTGSHNNADCVIGGAGGVRQPHASAGRVGQPSAAGQPIPFDPYGFNGYGWDYHYGPKAAGTLSPTTKEQLGIIAIAASLMPTPADAFLAGMAAVPIVATKTTALSGGKYVVYISRIGGKVEYIGMMGNFATRAATHLRDSSRIVIEIAIGLSKFEARALEQVLIERYGLNNLSNQINSIAASNTLYQTAISTGNSLLRTFGL